VFIVSFIVLTTFKWLSAVCYSINLIWIWFENTVRILQWRPTNLIAVFGAHFVHHLHQSFARTFSPALCPAFYRMPHSHSPRLTPTFYQWPNKLILFDDCRSATDVSSEMSPTEPMTANCITQVIAHLFISAVDRLHVYFKSSSKQMLTQKMLTKIWREAADDRWDVTSPLCVCVCVVQSLLDKEGAVQCRHTRENGKLVPLVNKFHYCCG